MAGTAAAAMKAPHRLLSKKTTVWLTPKDQQRVARLKKRWELNQTQAIRKALILAEAVA